MNAYKLKFARRKIKFLAGLILLFLVILAILAVYSAYNSDIDDTLEEHSDLTATRIIDGDTFELASGDIVRLICVDSPEKGEKGSKEALDFLFSLIYNKEVRLEKDIDDKDKYGRLLRYVYVLDEDGNEIFVNKEIVENEYGALFPYENNTAKCMEIGG